MACVVSTNFGPSGPLRDGAGVAKYRHEAVVAVLRVDAEDGLTCLLSRRRRAPFEGQWALPSGPMEIDESLDEAVMRHLTRKTDIAELSHLEQLITRSAPGRDPFDRTVATGYLGLVPWDAAGELPERASWEPVEQLRDMAFDHAAIVELAIERLRAKLSYTNIGFALAPDEFTIAQLRDAYVAVLGHDVSATNLQRILRRRGQLEPTGNTAPPGPEGGRPAALQRFTSRTLAVTDPFATLRP